LNLIRVMPAKGGIKQIAAFYSYFVAYCLTKFIIFNYVKIHYVAICRASVAGVCSSTIYH
jgi:hypothetical protein